MGVLLANTLLMGGCVQGKQATAGSDSAVAALTRPQRISPEAARSAPLFRSSGEPASWNELISATSEADVVLIGENHGHELGLAIAAALWEDVLERAPMGVLAMEFFERDQQDGLDDYLTGVIDERAFLRATQRSVGNYPPGHRAMVEIAKSRQRPVVAANAPRRYVRLARLEGYERLRGLTEEQGRLFAIPAADASAAYRASFDEVMNQNAGLTAEQRADVRLMAERSTALDATFRSQWMWDWTMAQSVARARALGSPVVLVVGRFHVERDGGTVQAVRAQSPDVRTLVVTFVDEPAGAMMPESDRGRGDFVVFVGRDRGQ